VACRLDRGTHGNSADHGGKARVKSGRAATRQVRKPPERRGNSGRIAPEQGVLHRRQLSQHRPGMTACRTVLHGICLGFLQHEKRVQADGRRGSGGSRGGRVQVGIIRNVKAAVPGWTAWADDGGG